MKKKTKQDYYELAKRRGFKWLGPFPKDTHCKTWWKCTNGHVFECRYCDINRGTGCRICAIEKCKKQKSDYDKLMLDTGFKLVEKQLPRNTETKTLWKCKKGHVWKASYHTIRAGSGCPFCYGNARKTKEDYCNLAKKYGFKWIAKEVPRNVFTKTLWECEKGHKWEAKYSNIESGWGCPYCSRNVVKTEKDYYDLAKNRKFKWIGKVLPKNNKGVTQWQCEREHIWKACYSSIQHGTGCPYCKDFINGSPVSKPQRKLNTILYGSLNYPESKYRIDIAIIRKSQKIAVEYDGQYWHEGNEEYDIKRDKFLVSRGWKVLHVKSRNLVPIRKQLKKIISVLLIKNNIINIFLKDWII